jgi:hypothetical protein
VRPAGIDGSLSRSFFSKGEPTASKRQLFRVAQAVSPNGSTLYRRARKWRRFAAEKIGRPPGGQHFFDEIVTRTGRNMSRQERAEEKGDLDLERITRVACAARKFDLDKPPESTR